MKQIFYGGWGGENSNIIDDQIQLYILPYTYELIKCMLISGVLCSRMVLNSTLFVMQPAHHYQNLGKILLSTLFSGICLRSFSRPGI